MVTLLLFFGKKKSASIIIKLDTTKNWVILNKDDTITITHYNPICLNANMLELSSIATRLHGR